MSSPPRKKERQEEVPTLSPEISHSGVIRFVVDKISTLDENGRYSEEVEVGGLLWIANVSKLTDYDDEDEPRFLSLYLYCLHRQSSPWNMKVKAESVLVHRESNENVSKKETFTACRFYNEWGGFHHRWHKVMDGGFVEDDKITVEFRFTFSDMKGVRVTPLTDFTVANDPCHDLTLVIEGEKIYVNKGFLSLHSDVFKTMFYGGFEEAKKNEIELKDIVREIVSVIEMLHVLYPNPKRVTVSSYEYLLKLADRFHIAALMERVEDFLVCTHRVKRMEKLRLADHYRLYGLRDFVFYCFDSVEDYNNIKETTVYENLSDATKIALLESMMKIAY